MVDFSVVMLACYEDVLRADALAGGWDIAIEMH